LDGETLYIIKGCFGRAVKLLCTLSTIALLAFVCSPSAHAQVFQISGGDSTLEGIAGASVTTYLPTSTMTTSVGRLSNGDVRFSASWLFAWRKWDVNVGDSTFSFTSGLAGLGIAERGVSFERHSDTSKLAFFVGAIGNYFQAPFASTFGGATAGAGVFYERRFTHITISSLDVEQGRKHTALQSAIVSWRNVKLTATAGWLANARQFDAEGEWRPTRRVMFLASHNVYVLPPTRSTIDELAGSGGLGRLDGYASAFHSVQGWGESAGGSIHPLDFLTVRTSWAGAPRQSSLFLTTGTETFRHWSLSESWTETSGHASYSTGGGYHSNRFTASIGQQILYDVSDGKFESAYVAALTLHVGNGSANFATSVNRAQHLYLYGASGQDFVGEPASARGHDVAWIEKTKYVVSGRVLDARGNPVEGAALQIGTEFVYTDGAGNFLARFKKPSAVPFLVLPNEFSTPGKWHIVSAPKSATPGGQISVVVSRY
jgi:hypothetical protein